MEIRRTANAGVLLKLDGVSILLDGVSQAVEPYLATPPDIRNSLLASSPDVLVFTHSHNDHYDPDFAEAYSAIADGVIIGPSDLGVDSNMTANVNIGPVSITSISSRHIGKYGDVEHFSYIISGTRCVWFLGDASPLQWRQDGRYPKPDVVIAPFAYAATAVAWERTKQMGANAVVLVHMPARNNDPFMLWNSVESVVANESQVDVFIPQLGETVIFH